MPFFVDSVEMIFLRVASVGEVESAVRPANLYDLFNGARCEGSRPSRRRRE